jgi:hypothetical protein
MFDQMKSFENLNQNKIYAVLETVDGIDMQSLIFDMGKALGEKANGNISKNYSRRQWKIFKFHYILQ